MMRLAIVQVAGEWKILAPEVRLGGFATRQLALSAGARLAHQVEATGEEVEFLVQDPVGRLQALALDEAEQGPSALNFPSSSRI